MLQPVSVCRLFVRWSCPCYPSWCYDSDYEGIPDVHDGPDGRPVTVCWLRGHDVLMCAQCDTQLCAATYFVYDRQIDATTYEGRRACKIRIIHSGSGQVHWEAQADEDGDVRLTPRPVNMIRRRSGRSGTSGEGRVLPNGTTTGSSGGGQISSSASGAASFRVSPRFFIEIPA